MKICLLTNPIRADSGPEPSEAYRLAGAFTRLGHEAYVLAPPAEGDDQRGFRPPYPLYRIPWAGERALAMHALIRLGWDRFVSRFNVLDCHGLSVFGVTASLLRQFFAMPVVLTPRTGELLPEVPGPTQRRRRVDYALRNVDAVVAKSLPVRTELVRLGVHPRRIRLIPKGFGPLKLDDHAGYIHPRPYALAMGASLDYKAFADLVRAFATAQSARPEIDLLIAGEGADRERLLWLRSQLQVDGRIEFLGPVGERFRLSLVKGALFAVFPERSRTVPDDVLSCLALGCPVVMRDVPGHELYVSDGGTGLIAPGSGEAPLAAAIARLMTDDTLRRQMGESAAAWAGRFSWDRIAARYLALYRRLLSGGRRRRMGDSSDAATG